MTRGNIVKIGDLTFSTKKAAVEHFMDQREVILPANSGHETK